MALAELRARRFQVAHCVHIDPRFRDRDNKRCAAEAQAPNRVDLRVQVCGEVMQQVFAGDPQIDGTVGSVSVAAGDLVVPDAELLRIAADAGD